MLGYFKTRAQAEAYRYNRWSGNPNGNKFDPAQCAEEVSRDWLMYQCCKKPGHGPDGLYCKQHGKKADAYAAL